MKRLGEIGFGMAFLGMASVGATQFFMVHQRFENAGSYPYLVALGLGMLWIIGFGFRLLFFPRAVTA